MTLANADLLPVAEDRRTWNWWHIASLWIGMAICIPTYTLASGLIAQGWTWQAAVGAVILGNVVVLVPIALNSHAGTRHGVVRHTGQSASGRGRSCAPLAEPP